ncbi:hypothetical protein IRP16_004131 [Salmonella enterica]|nr:hypothetical protein [Salmonella enterica]EGM2345077.1 hypothetical protein [Salmonella enterica]EGM2363769.1 hypothetical protein [Salmonella enterica]
MANYFKKIYGSEEDALAMLSMIAFTLMARRGISEIESLTLDNKGIRLEITGFIEREETISIKIH